ncbi:MAG: hypothetical protein LBI60_05075 [Bacteroidales bacterium]|jgi:hypothetical protein|nr:hypothetical protein [Bacteroidales bacterium]
MKLKKHCLIILSTVLLSFHLQAQNNGATAQLDSNNIMIGDQVHLTLTFTSNEITTVSFPVYCDTCITGLEIVKQSPIDTIRDENGFHLSRQLIITAFDSGEYVIPSMPFYSADSVILAATESLLLSVHTLAVDTTLTIKDIKEPLSAPITIREAIPYIIGALLVFGIVVAGIFLSRYLNDRRKPKATIKEKPKIPAHVIALEKLNILWQKKLYQSGYIKQYYSELSDIMRVYIEHRWDIAAMEMVSSEIITALSGLEIPAEAMQKLKQTLYLSDMVKFAKANPLSDESSICYQNCVDFVQTTKQEKELVIK